MPENIVNQNTPEEYSFDKILKDLKRFKYTEIENEMLGFYIRRAKDRIKELPKTERQLVIIEGLGKAEDISTELQQEELTDKEKEEKFYSALTLSVSLLKNINS